MQMSKEMKEQLTKQIKEMMESSTKAIIEKLDTVLAMGTLREQEVKATIQNDSYVFAKLLITAYFNYLPYAPNKTQKEYRKILKQIEYSI